MGTRRLSLVHERRRGHINISIWSDKYLLLEVLKDTAATEVLHVRHRSLGTDRIIKSIPAENVSGVNNPEAELLKNLHHPGIPVIYDVAKTNDRFYIIEEYIGGQSLQEVLAVSNSVSEDFLYDTAVALCDVMLYLHTREVPILYQDLKPEHIFFYENRLRLIDFGIACYQNHSEFKNHYGTKGYAAPEQYLDGPIDEGADIYAFGQVLKEIAGCVPPPLSVWVTTLISKATMTNRKERFASFQEIADFLAPSDKQKNKGAGTNLLNSIAIAGSNSGVGTTHIAVALTATLRSLGIKCVYQDCTNSGTVISMEQEGCLHTRGSYGKSKLFLGELELGPGIDAKRKEYLLIKDYGTRSNEMVGDILLYVVGGRCWQLESGRRNALEAAASGNLRVICNQGSMETTKQYSKALGRNIYRFPTDQYPMTPDRKKLRLFKKMLGIKRKQIEAEI